MDWIARPVDISKRVTSLLLLKVVMCKLNRICSGRCSFRFSLGPNENTLLTAFVFLPIRNTHWLSRCSFTVREREKDSCVKLRAGPAPQWCLSFSTSNSVLIVLEDRPKFNLASKSKFRLSLSFVITRWRGMIAKVHSLFDRFRSIHSISSSSSYRCLCQNAKKSSPFAFLPLPSSG